MSVKTEKSTTATVVDREAARTKNGKDGWVYITPSEPMNLSITPKDVKAAKGKCMNASECVVVQAILRAFGFMCRGGMQAEVGPCATLITLYGSKQIIRYKTSDRLKKALKHWDATKDDQGNGDWGLPPGVYTLMPMTDREVTRPSRHKLIKGVSGGKLGRWGVLIKPLAKTVAGAKRVMCTRNALKQRAYAFK